MRDDLLDQRATKPVAAVARRDIEAAKMADGGIVGQRIAREGDDADNSIAFFSQRERLARPVEPLSAGGPVFGQPGQVVVSLSGGFGANIDQTIERELSSLVKSHGTPLERWSARPRCCGTITDSSSHYQGTTSRGARRRGRAFSCEGMTNRHGAQAGPTR